MIVLGIVLAIVILIALWAMSVYNGLVRQRNMKDEAWSGIDVQLKRRFDLIPNIVETVKGYASHESETLKEVVAARTSVISAGADTQKRIEAENALTGTLRTLFAVAESYPQLKANENFINLQNTLGKIEDELQMARRYYNGTVRDLNTMIQRFPAVLIARQFGFSEAPFFEADASERQNVKVSFAK